MTRPPDAFADPSRARKPSTWIVSPIFKASRGIPRRLIPFELKIDLLQVPAQRDVFEDRAAFLHDLLDVRHVLGPERAVQIGVGFVTAFLAALVVVGPFLRFVGRSGFAPFAWYRIVAGVALLAAVAAGWM